MSDRQEVDGRLHIEGRPYIVKLIHNPTVDDIVITEGRIAAYERMQGSATEERRVQRDIRDFLIRLGVER